MKCPKCREDNNGVLKTLQDEYIIWRLRQCTKCYHKWETSEIEDERLGRGIYSEDNARKRHANA